MSSNVFKTYPYPVLGNSSDIEGLFEFSVEPEISGSEVEISIRITLNHPDLENMINSGYATFDIDVGCKKTLYKKSTQTNKKDSSVSIPADKLRDRVEVEAYIVSTKHIDQYRPGGIRLDMDLGPVAIEPGDIIADGGTKWFIADKYFDPLKSPISSFIKIMKSSTVDGSYSVDFDNPAITIKVPEVQFNDFEYINRHKDGVLVHSSIVLPVLVEAIIKLEDNEYASYSWADKLQSMLASKNLDQYMPFIAAQELLGLPIKRNVDAVKSIINTSGDNDD